MSDRPILCDLCSGEEKILWEWWTPNEADSMEEALETGKAWFEDNGWYICDACHQLVLAQAWEALKKRALANIGSKILCRLDDDGKLHAINPEPHVSNAHRAFRRCYTFYTRIGENSFTQ